MLDASCAANDGLDDYDAFVRKKKRAKTSLVRPELDHYLDEEVLPRSPASESAFSTSGQILSPHRSRLHWTTLEALMCARSWLWSAENSGNMSSKISNEYATLLDEIEPEDEGEILTGGVASLFEDGD
ncbi:zinc finger BED domain-containing protein DAYSLEEPER [Trifolium repens]|nr:zinc finger BED domain-containing protein DAYSLEEPER [Trifolium repens]